MTCSGCQRRRSILRAAILAPALLTSRAFGRLPPGAKPGPFHAWFEAQYNQDGQWCCNVSDGHQLNDDEWKEEKGAYWVLIGKPPVWYRIEPYMMRDVKRSGPNPTGHAIVWYTPENEGDVLKPGKIYCFAPGFEG